MIGREYVCDMTRLPVYGQVLRRRASVERAVALVRDPSRPHGIERCNWTVCGHSSLPFDKSMNGHILRIGNHECK